MGRRWRVECRRGANQASGLGWGGLLVVVVVVAATLTGLAAAPRAGQAQPASVPAVLAGTWVHDGDLERGRRTVDAAFASTVASLPELFRGMARDRIRGSMPVRRRITVALDGPRVRVTLESAERTTIIEGPLGSRARVTGGEPGTVVTPRLQGGWLELRYQGEGSELRQLFSTEPNGSRMHLDFDVTGSRLPTPVRYRLEYVPAGR